MNIRLLGPADLDALLDLYTHLHAQDAPRPERARVDAVGHALLDSPAHRVYGLFVEGALVASCVLHLLPNLTRGCRPYGLIENVVTHAEHRRRGHGQAVLERALADAWATHCYKVMLLTGRLDAGTFRFYENAGFDRHGKQAFIAKPGSATLSSSRETKQP